MLDMPADAVEIRRRNTFSIGVMIALSSWALIFITLVWGYIAFRLRTDSWLGVILTPSATAVASFNSLVIALSSLSLSRAFRTDARARDIWAWSALALGVCFLSGQFYLWQILMGEGLHWQTSTAGSMFFLLTGFHAIHIFGGLTALLLLCLRFNKWHGTLTASGIKYFWDFLLAVWVVIFVLIFIIQ